MIGVQPLLLVLFSAFLHALWNAALKEEEDTQAAAVAVLAVAAATAAAIVPLSRGPAFPQPAGIAWAAAAGICEAGYFATLAIAFRRAPLGLAYAVARGGSIAAVWPASILWLGEAVTARGIGGAAVLCAGIAALGLASRRLGASAGVAWAGLSALCIAAYHLCYKSALACSAQPAALFAASLAVALPINLSALGRRGLGRVGTCLRARPVGLAGAGIVAAASFLFLLVALEGSGAGAVVTLRNTSVVFAQALAWAIGERPGRLQVAGAVLVALGAVLLGWPGG
jgi:drug/metabolite transporter (DMT)-like permease